MYLLREYNKVTKYILENNNEEIKDETMLLKKENLKIKDQLILSSSKNQELLNEISKLKKENDRLNLEVRKIEDLKKEVVPLRNYAFLQLNNKNSEKKMDLDINDIKKNLNEIQGVIVGGSTTWTSTIKPILKWEYISKKTLGFNSRILKNKIVIVNTDDISQELYYKIMSNINEIKTLKFIGNVTGIEESLININNLINDK